MPGFMLHTLKERLGQKGCYDHFYRPSWKTAFDTGRRRLWGRHTAKFVKREDVSRLGRRGEGIELDEDVFTKSPHDPTNLLPVPGSRGVSFNQGKEENSEPIRFNRSLFNNRPRRAGYQGLLPASPNIVPRKVM